MEEVDDVGVVGDRPRGVRAPARDETRRVILEVDGTELQEVPEPAALDDLASQPHRRHVAVVEAARGRHPGALRRGQHHARLEPVSAERLLAQDRLPERQRRLGRLAVSGLAEQHRDDVDARVLDDIPPVGREPLHTEVASHRRSALGVASSEASEPDRPGQRRDVADRVQRVTVGAGDPARPEQPDADPVVHRRQVQAGTAGADPAAARMRSGSASTRRIAST